MPETDIDQLIADLNQQVADGLITRAEANKILVRAKLAGYAKALPEAK